MEVLVRLIWGLIKTMLVIVFILCVIVLIIVLSIPYALYRLLGGRPFSTNRLMFKTRRQPIHPKSTQKESEDVEDNPPRFKANYDPDVIDVKATVVERHDS